MRRLSFKSDEKGQLRTNIRTNSLANIPHIHAKSNEIPPVTAANGGDRKKTSSRVQMEGANEDYMTKALELMENDKETTTVKVQPSGKPRLESNQIGKTRGGGRKEACEDEINKEELFFRIKSLQAKRERDNELKFDREYERVKMERRKYERGRPKDTEGTGQSLDDRLNRKIGSVDDDSGGVRLEVDVENVTYKMPPLVEKVTSPKRKRFTNHFQISSNSIVNSIINTAGVVAVPDETMRNPTVAPNISPPKYSRDQRRRTFDHDRTSSMEILVPLIKEKPVPKKVSRIKLRRKSFEHFDHFDEKVAEARELTELKKRFGQEKDHHENYDNIRQEEQQRNFVAGKNKGRRKFHLPHKSVGKQIHTGWDEGSSRGSSRGGSRDPSPQPDERAMKALHGGGRRGSRVFIPPSRSVPVSRDATPPRRRLSFDNLKVVLKDGVSFLRSQSEKLLTSGGDKGEREKKIGDIRSRRKREDIASNSIAFWWIYNTNRKRRRRSAVMIQRCWRGWRSWVIQEKWRITAKLEREAQRIRDHKADKLQIRVERNEKLKKKKVKLSGINAAKQVGHVVMTKKDKKEAERLAFKEYDDAILISAHYKHGWPKTKSEREPLWTEYKKYMEVDRSVKMIWNRLKLLKEAGDLNRIQEKVLDVLEEGSPIVEDFLSEFKVKSSSKSKSKKQPANEELLTLSNAEKTVTFDEEINKDLG